MTVTIYVGDGIPPDDMLAMLRDGGLVAMQADRMDWCSVHMRPLLADEDVCSMWMRSGPPCVRATALVAVTREADDGN